MAAKAVKQEGVFVLQHTEWVWFAVVAMILFSIGNLLLKLAVDNVDFSKARLELSSQLVLVVLLGAFVLYAGLSILGLFQADAVKYVAAFVLVGVVGFAALIQALKTGKVSVVNAVLAMSIVLVTFLSVVFLGEKISFKEMAAMGLALASIVVLTA